VSNYFNETYYGDYYYHYYYYDYYYDDYYYGGNGKYAYPVAWSYNGYGYPSSVYFGVSSAYSYAEYGSYAGSSTEIQPALSGFSGLANLKNLAADAKLTFDKAVATYNYVVAYTDLYMQADAKGWELDGTALGDSIDASKALSGDLWGECDDANTSLFSSARLDNTLSLLLGASQAGLQNDLTLEKAQASNFGQYQINWRQQANTGAADVAWATNVKSARDSYFTALGGAEANFNDTMTGAMGTYYDSMLEAQISRSESHYTSSQTRYDALESAMNDYSTAAFNSQKTAAEKYRDAAIKEITDNAKDEKDAKEKEKDHYQEKAKEHEQDLDDKFEDLAEKDADKNGVMGSESLEYGISGTAKDDFLNDYGNASAARSTAQSNLLAVADAAKTTNTEVVNAKTSRTTAMNNTINAAKIANKNARAETDKETDKEYKNAANDDWNTYYSAAVGANADYMKAYGQTEKTFNTAKKGADSAYDEAVLPAWLTYSQTLREYETLYLAAVAHAGDDNFNVANYFASGYQDDYLHIALRTTGEGDNPTGSPNDDIGFVIGNIDNRDFLNSSIPIMVVENRQEFLAARNKQMLEFLENEKERFSQELEKKRIQWQQKIDSAFYATQDDWKANLSPEELKFLKLFERPPKVRYPLIHGEMIHAFLDVFGLVPVIGEPADVVNGLLYAAQGRKLEAGLSFTSTIPFWGTFGTIGKRIKSFFRGADAGTNIIKLGDELLPPPHVLKKILPEKGFTDIVVHADGDLFRVLRNGDEVYLSHRDIANFIQSKGITDDIRLISCDAGTKNLAQDLANKLGVRVKAANTTVRVYEDGFLELLYGRTWQIFKPGGK